MRCLPRLNELNSNLSSEFETDSNVHSCISSSPSDRGAGGNDSELIVCEFYFLIFVLRRQL